jgi:hypothetical protein
MRLFIINLIIVVFMTACHSQSTEPKKAKDSHETVAAEVIQATSYTYLRLTENGEDVWVAVPKMDAKVGETYYYKGGIMMKDFVSKDLGRTFPEVYFIGGVSTEPITEDNQGKIAAEQQLEFQQQQNAEQKAATETNGMHKAVVKEILQANKYTYLLMTENGADNWVALPKIETAEVGKTYYYSGEMPMTNFESKDLGRTFELVYFIGGVSEDPSGTQTASNPHAGNTTTEKVEVEKIEQVGEGISIKELYSNINKYGGKAVKIKGKVTKYNASIMGKNWLHLEDGTQDGANIDLTATTSSNVNVGDVVTVVGKITLNKDFGAGYFYEVIMEDATISK